jgi:methylmalonyl-CoA/ethylmalonyl-CoA epimerase
VNKIEPIGNPEEHIEIEIDRFKKPGFKIMGEKPGIGALKKHLAFLPAKSTNGVLIEPCNEIK